MELAWLAFIIPVLVIFVRLVAGSFDDDHVREHIAELEGEVVRLREHLQKIESSRPDGP